MRVTSNLSAARADARARLDAAAEGIRLLYITPGDGKAVVYREKVAEVERFNLDPSPESGNYLLLRADMNAHGLTLAEAAARVAAKITEWKSIAAAIEEIAGQAADTIENSQDPAEISAAAEAMTHAAVIALRDSQ